MGIAVTCVYTPDLTKIYGLVLIKIRLYLAVHCLLFLAGLQHCYRLNTTSKSCIHTSSSQLASKDYYKILGVSKSADQKEIKKAYFNVSKFIYDCTCFYAFVGDLVFWLSVCLFAYRICLCIRPHYILETGEIMWDVTWWLLVWIYRKIHSVKLTLHLLCKCEY